MELPTKLAEWFGIAGFFGAMLALRLNYLTRRDTKRDKRPLFVVTTSQRSRIGVLAPKDWGFVTVRLRSRNNQPYTCERATIAWPRRGGVCQIGYNRGPDVNARPVLADPTGHAVRSIPMKLSVEHAGKAARYLGSMLSSVGDDHSEEFLVFLPPSWLSVLRTRLFQHAPTSSRRSVIWWSVVTHSDRMERMVIRRLIIVPVNTSIEPPTTT